MAVLTVGRCSHLVAAGILAGLCNIIPSQAEDSLEYAVKAAYLVKFIPFIEWPDTAFASPAQPVTICIVGDDPFGGKLDAQAGQGSGSRAIAVKRVKSYDPAAECQLLFLGKSAAVDDVLATTGGEPVVTVTDSTLPQHGVISFVIEANHVRFDIDDAAAAKAGLKVSSKLLELAHAVKRRPAQ